MTTENHKPKARIIAVVNQKGGVGKTTTVINVGAALSQLGNKVLLVDLDPQGNLSVSAGVPPQGLEDNTIFEVLKDVLPVKEAIYKAKKFDILPANINLSGAEVELSGTAGREFLLREALETIQDDYDYILIDCSPSLGILTLNALVAAKEVFIPLQPEYLAMQGITQLVNTVSIVKSRLNKEIGITGVIVTMYDNRKNLNKEVVDKIKQFFDEKLFKTYIRAAVSLAEAPSFGVDIFDYKPNSTGADDYLALTKEINKKRK